MDIAKRIECGQLQVLKALSRSPVVIRQILTIGKDLQRGARSIRDIVFLDEEELTEDILQNRVKDLSGLRVEGRFFIPGEYTTGGKQKLLGISKRGNSYLRRLFVQGARAVLQQSAKQSSGLSSWLAQLTTRTHRNVAAVALANKRARMAWAVLAKNEPYRPPILADAATAGLACR